VYGFSTGWNIRRHARIADALDEICELGFQKIELAGLTQPQMRELVSLQKQGAAPQIVGLHSFCPLPPVERKASFGDLLDLASRDQKERGQAVEYTKRTIDAAAELGGQVVIVHLGSVEVDYVPRTLLRWMTAYGPDSGEYRRRLGGLLDERARRAGPHLDAALEGLAELDTHARSNGVKIGVENRFMYYQIPNIAELRIILSQFGEDTAVGYWHDIGHAHMNRILRVEDQTNVAEDIKRRMIGVHVHDVVTDANVDPAKVDHRAPSTGTVDFVRERENISDGVLKVVELRREVDAADVVKGLAYLRRIGF
jgi:sugar phosphate isomerase/epimerase